jgi:hypothetical protein
MTRLNEAKQVLSDAARCAEYREQLAAGTVRGELWAREALGELKRVREVERKQQEKEKKERDTLGARLDDSDAGVRLAAVVALGRMPPGVQSQHAGAVAARLEDLDAGVRLAAVEALGRMSSEVMSLGGVSLRDAIRAELMSLLELDASVKGADRCVKRKLIDHLFDPETYRKSSDKLPHEEAGKHGAKRGGYYFWLIRQVRRLAEPTTPEWYGQLIHTRERYDTACMTAYAQVLLQRFPVFDGAFAYDAPEQSDAFRDFDKRMQDVLAALRKLRALRKLPKVSRKSKMQNIDIIPPKKRVCLDNDIPIPLPPVASPVPTEWTELKGELDLEEFLRECLDVELKTDLFAPNEPAGSSELPPYRSLGAAAPHAASAPAARAPALSREPRLRHLVACAAMCGEEDEEEK